MTARLGVGVLFGAPAAFLALFFLYPLAAILTRALGGEEGGLSAFSSLLGDRYYLGRIWFTTWQAAVSTALTVAVGLPMAYLFARRQFVGKSALMALSTAPFVMPTIVVAMGFVALLGHQGLLNTALMAALGLEEPPLRLTNTLLAVLLAHAFYNYAVVVRIVAAYWSTIAPQMEESASLLGAGPLAVLWHITLPALAPAIASAAALAFTFCFTSFGVVLVLGGPQFATLEVGVYELTAKLLRLELAAALAVIQMVFTTLFLLVYARLQQRASAPLTLAPQEASQRRTRGVGDALLVAALVGMALLLLAPLWALAERALSVGDGYGLAHFRSLLSNVRGEYFYLPLPQVIANSVRFALLSTAIALPVGAAAAWAISRPGRRGVSVADALLMLPLGVSAVIMGFGFLVAFNRDPIDLRASPVLLVVAHALVAYPFVVRSVLPAMRGMPHRLREAAAVLGAPPLRAFLHVELPIVTPALLVGATFAFAVSMGEFGASLLLVRPESTTMPVAIYRMIGQPGAANLGRALAMSATLMVVVALVFAAIERFRYRSAGGF